MRFTPYIALSIVASNLLLNAAEYKDWAQDKYNSGDIITITDGKVLNRGFSLASGTLTANITLKSSSGCGLVACFNQESIFGGSGTIQFNVNGNNQSGSAFTLQGGKMLTIDSGIRLNIAMRNANNLNAFTLESGSTLNINGDLNISGSTKNAIVSKGATINIGGGQRSNTRARQLTFNGNILAQGGKTRINLSNGSRITGNFKGERASELILDINASTHNGNVENDGTTNITLQNNGKLQGNLTTSGTSLNLAFNTGSNSITGNVSSTATTNTLTNTNGTNSIGGSVSFGGSTNNITINSGTLNANGGISLGKGNNASNQIAITGGSLSTNTITTSGKTNAKITNNGQFSGHLRATGTSFDLNATGGTISGSITSTANTSNLNFSGVGNVLANITTGGQNTTINAEGNFILNNITTTSNESNITFKGNTYTRGGITIGGSKNTTTFSDAASITGNLTSTANTSNITFKDNAYIGQNATISGNTTTIGFTDNTKIKGTLSLSARTADVTFSKNSSLKHLEQTSGTSTIKFTDDAKITNGASISNATATIDFDRNAQFNGDFKQNKANTTITFKDQAKFNGNFQQSNHGTSKIKFDNQASMTGNINVVSGETDILFTDKAKITGDIKAQGLRNKVKFTEGTRLEGNLTLGGATGSTAEGDLDGTTVTGNITGHAQVTLKMNKTLVEGQLSQQGGTLNAEITDSQINKGFLGNKNSSNTIDIKNSKISDGVKQNTGSLNLTAEGLIIEGGLEGTSSNNVVTMQKGSISGGIKQDFGSMDFTSNETTITGGFLGTNNSNNTVKMTKGSLEGGIKQDSGKLDFVSEETNVTGGFEGTNNSHNTANMTKGSLTGGIKQNTGSLHFKSKNTDISGSFQGISSENILEIAGGNFNNGDIQQIQGKLKAELVNVSELRSFSGSNSQNIVHLLQTEITSVSQYDGTLEFNTDSNVNGPIKGLGNSQTKITVTGADVRGAITQHTGSMTLTLTNANLTTNEGILINDAEAKFYVNQVTNSGGITLNQSNANGTFNNFTLEGTFSQAGGNSILTFADTKFNNDSQFTNTQNASLIFTRSEIKSIQANDGTTAFNLSNSKMENFIGTWGDHTVSLITSEADSLSQTGGSLTFNASNNSTLNHSITGTSGSTLTISLSDNSKINENVSNVGNTTMSMQDSQVGGNVTQTGASMNLTAMSSQIQGSYTQNGGVATFNLTNSSIDSGVILNNLEAGSLNLNQNSKIQQGLHATNSSFDFSLLNGSSIEGGFTQEGGNVTGTLNTNAKIQGGLTLNNGETNLTLFNQSSLDDGITANNHRTSILLDNSSINGAISVDGGSFKLVAQNGSTITTNINGAEGGATIKNADLTLIVDTGSTFTGNINQTNNKQTIIVKNNSTLAGSVKNTDVEASIAVSDNSDITGKITQTNGSLLFDLSRGGRLGGGLDLTDVTTILSGVGNDNSIGEFGITQIGGKLTGAMHGLTLKGQFTQIGGISDATFTKSDFQGEINITNADSSSLTFIQSQLKNVDIRGGENNTLKLLNQTTMTGDLTVRENSKTLLKMQDSKLDGKIDVKVDSILTLDTLDSEITGNIDVNTGGLQGQTNHTTIGGDITLTNTQSTISFTNKSIINGNLTATEGNNKINFNDSTIQGNLSQTGGNIELDLSNGSTIGGDLSFKNTIAHLTGAPANNKINGDFTSENTTLTGEISSLTLQGKFTQTQGSSSITFKEDSLFLGEVSITDANPSNLTFSQNSGIQNKINITNGTNVINLIGQSFIKGDTTITNGTTSINASALSSITGNITATDSTTNLNFDESFLKGDISQTGGILNLTAHNNSILDSNISSTNAQTNLVLQNSTLNGNITQDHGNFSAVLKQNAKFNAPEALGEVKVTDANLSIEADNSYWGSNLVHTNATLQEDVLATLNFINQAIYEGTMELNKIKTQAHFTDSTLTSTSITINEGSFNLTYDHSTQGGVIDLLEANNTEATITTANQSLSSILELKASQSTLKIDAQDRARLIGNVFLNTDTTATYQAQTNGILNLNTKLLDTASSLDVRLSGGMLLGVIEKDNQAQVLVTLKQDGEDGGRWAITGDSQVTSLTLNNQDTLLGSEAIFGSSFENPLNLVDFTLNFEDTLESSRVGREMIVRPLVTEEQPLPPEAPNQTYVRQLKTQRLSGNHGFFRIYADLGAGLADNILATQASGEHTIQVIYRADTFREIGDTRIVVAKVEQPNLPVSFKGTQSEVGLTRYNTEIIKENAKDGKGFEWIIGQATEAGMSYASKIIASILQTQYRAFYIESDGLTQRLGDLERIKRDQNFWIRGYIGQGEKKATPISIGATDRYFSLWSGFDYDSLGLTGHNFVGGFFNYSGMQTENKDYFGSTSNIALGIYNVFKANSGFYFDLLAKYIFSQSAFDISNYSLAKNKPSFNNHNFLANLEMGYTFYLGEKRKSMYLQPLFQATSGWMTESKFDFVDVTGEIIHSKMGATAPAMFKTGLWFGKSFGENIRANLKIGSFFAYDVNSGGKMEFADSKKQASYKTKGDFRMIFSGHGDFAFSDSFRLYTSLDTSFFGSYNTIFNFNLGIRFTFGKRNDYVPPVPMVYNPDRRIPVQEEVSRRNIPVIQKQTQRDIDKNYAGKPRQPKRPDSQLAPTTLPSANPQVQAPSRRYSHDRAKVMPQVGPVEFIDPRKNR